MVRSLAICCFVLIQAALGQHVDRCAWITQPTAAGILGGEAISTVREASGHQPASCIFTQTSGRSIHVLQVSVEISAEAHAQVGLLAKACTADATPLPAIGNEAIVCSDRSAGGPGEHMVGRVRDQVFRISLTSTQRGDPSFTHDVLRAKIRAAAEQVSGNLF